MTKFGVVMLLLFFLLSNALSFVAGGFGGFFYCKWLILKYVREAEQQMETYKGDGAANPQYRDEGDYHGTSLYR